MSGVLVIAAWCFLQVESRHPEIITSNSNHGNFLDNDKWLSTVSQYDKDKYWNKFRDLRHTALRYSCGLFSPLYIQEICFNRLFKSQK
nr:testican-1-like [Agelaius phoeniceus]